MPPNSSIPTRQEPRTIPEPLGQADTFLAFQERLSLAAQVNRPVLLIGERGTGKELAAARLHYLSPRWEGPLVALNCAALTPTLIESELFGHEEGAFTGAGKRRPGRFELASGGTLFLDEIGNIPMETQEKILRAVEYGSFERVGGIRPIQVDVRIVGATNANLVKLSEQGRFKRDLLDRLSFEVLFLPPLRERGDDILLLANHFAARMAYELGRSETPEFSDEAEDALETYPWPGNVRELKNVVERAVYRTSETLIKDVLLDPFVPPFPVHYLEDSTAASPGTSMEHSEPGEIGRTLADAVRETEVCAICRVMREARMNQKEAAKLLGLSYHQFRWLYRKHRTELELRMEG